MNIALIPKIIQESESRLVRSTLRRATQAEKDTLISIQPQFKSMLYCYWVHYWADNRISYGANHAYIRALINNGLNPDHPDVVNPNSGVPPFHLWLWDLLYDPAFGSKYRVAEIINLVSRYHKNGRDVFEAAGMAYENRHDIIKERKTRAKTAIPLIESTLFLS